MNYIIDGHNLISKIPGLDLSMPDDEQRLTELLIQYCQGSRHKLEVYFDQAPVGQAGVVNYGRVRTHFVSKRQTADDAIRKRLSLLGRSAKTWAVVSSDRAVQVAARAVYAQVLSADEFSSLLQTSLHAGSAQPEPAADESLSEAEVREWEAIFKGKRGPR
ncbi:MAG: hypothetical protein A2136_10865 [Chloroflexi bacterium RBG_16_54_11]|nr:MAG: hypothetical protein A2136_10865 [Chloroflexi bacterium RBG_16_54_11]